MASPFSGSSGRKAAVAEMTYLDSIWRDQKDRIRGGKIDALGSLDGGYRDARSDYSRAIDQFTPYATTGLAGFNAYADASGVNGQEGYDRAVGSFRASPGYQWQVDQATDAVARKAGAIGALGSGNTMTAISDRAGHMADQEYDDYLSRLDNLAKTGYAATTAQAGLTKGMGDLSAQQGRDRAGVHQAFTGMAVNERGNLAGQTVAALHGGMTAGQSAAANRWGMGMSILNLGANLAGGGGLKNLFA